MRGDEQPSLQEQIVSRLRPANTSVLCWVIWSEEKNTAVSGFHMVEKGFESKSTRTPRRGPWHRHKIGELAAHKCGQPIDQAALLPRTSDEDPHPSRQVSGHWQLPY
jgi:hypothetical protein